MKLNRNYTYKLLPIDITNGLNDKMFQFNGESVYYFSGDTEIEVRLEKMDNDAIPLSLAQRITAPYTRLYVTAPAVAETIHLLLATPKEIRFEGEEITIANIVDVDVQSPVEISEAVIEQATGWNIYNDTCVVADTEYTRVVANMKKFTVKPRGGQLKINMGGVGESGSRYILLEDGQPWSEDNIYVTGTFYFQSPTAGTVVEFTIWT